MQSTTIQINLDALLASVDAARTSTTEKRWLNAIETAYDYLLQQDSVTLDADGSLLVESATEPGKIYAANGRCSCTAYIGGNPCWHRAAGRLVRRMLDNQRVAQHAAALVHLADAGEDADGLVGAIGRCEGAAMAQAAIKEVARLREQQQVKAVGLFGLSDRLVAAYRAAQVVTQQEKARQVKALGDRLAERRRAYDEVAELFA